ncbi:MAG TPA: phosphoribosylformylglycinamidine synthase subunit PurL [Chthoniobacterales bacterium]|jgi:phosphoribosylformylglycinamidine synthase II|nr:phosphoribosylformylglycinamidine synthase subunit PurL [Chthoniobacterales bacterium]
MVTEITPELIRRHGLTVEEYGRIKAILGRDPNFTELGVFSVMWSEHCSYKNTRLELKKLPTTGPKVLVKAGEENAGVIDIGDGWGVAFKMESHNHPSAVEPFQGAATGVGGIIRDIFTMGARPVFLLDSLRFGPIRGTTPAAKSNRRLFSEVVAGIAHYGNCVGIPTIGGEIYFDQSYEGNPLVNVFCLGILRHQQIARGAAKGVGNPVFYVGSETGRDGLAGASFASRDLTEESKQDRPAVQVGDPFKGKLLLEACLELLASGCVAGIQDMGAAGLTCSTCETASRGGTGVEIDLALVPQREPGMTPYEILLSESQERMLIIVERGREATVKEIFDKWDLPYACVGKVTDDGVMRVLNHGRVEVEIPAEKLANDAPVYEREVVADPPVPEVRIEDIPPADLHESLMRLLAEPTIASKNWVYRQYDHTVRAGTVVPPGSDAAVFYVREADKYLAATTDCNGLYCKLNPREGARIAVAEAARNLVCSGAKPLAVTDNLNFGNPYHPANFWQLREAVEGLAEACRRFDTPVTGGNVSLYNQNPNGAIDPTPTVGMVGVIDQERWITRQYFRDASDVIYLIGPIGHELGASQYLTIIHGRREFLPPRLSYDLELGVQAVVLALIQQGLVKSAHDCSEGGFGVAVAECCISGERRIGASVDFGHWPERLDQILFNESQSRVIISVGAEEVGAMETVCAAAEIPFGRVGEVGGSDLIISTQRETLRWDVAELYQAWYASIERAMSSQ